MNQQLTVKEAQECSMYKGASIYRCEDKIYDDANRIENYNPKKHDDLIVVGHTFIGDIFVIQVKEL